MIEADILRLPDHEPTLLEMIKNKAFMARWVTQFDINQETQFWYVIKDKPMSIDDYAKKRRRELKIAGSHLDVRRIDLNTMMNHSYPIYLEVFKMYDAGRPLTEVEYQEDLARHDVSIYHYWGIFLVGTGSMIGYCVNHDKQGYCNYSAEKILPTYKSIFPSLFVNFVMDQYYLSDPKMKFISAGARSIYHDTEIQSFLIHKCGYRKAYCFTMVKFLPIVPLFIQICNFFSFLVFKSKKLSTILCVLNYHMQLYQSRKTG